MDELDELMLLGAAIDDEFNIRPGRQQLETARARRASLGAQSC